MFTQPLVHGFQEAVGVGVFRSGIGKCNQVNGNPVLMKPNQKGGTVRAAPSLSKKVALCGLFCYTKDR